MAADVHDLIMQDLAFAVANARDLADGPGATAQAGTVLAAGERALAGARGLIGRLGNEERRPVIEAVRESVQLAARSARLTFDADGVPSNVQPDPPTLDTLVHASREAVTNAVKHAEANEIEVVLEYGDEWRLQVRDSGRGFDIESVELGFGMRSMRRHARALGGSMQLSSSIAAGTVVEVKLP